MKQWECIVCGWIYDEAKGDPDSGIAPGTKFEDIPDDWYCPECGVGKDDFELVEVVDQSTPPSIIPASVEYSNETIATPDAQVSTNKQHIVIIGAGLAGYGLLKEIRKIDNNIGITIICADDGRAYSKPALSTGYTKNTSADDLTQATAMQMAQTHGVNVLANNTVTDIDTEHQHVVLNHGAGLVHYTKLVLAQGAHCIQPPLSGNAQDQVFTINDLQDFEQFQSAAKKRKAKRIGIIGAGLIGCEYANDLLNGGFKTVSVDPMSTCLPTLLPEKAGKAVQSALESLGAEFHFGKLVKAVDDNDNGLSLTLDDGSTLDVDMVLSAIGVSPNVELAKAAGIDTNRGIVTNRLLETSANNVYAVGDCAEVNGMVLVYVAPLVTGTRALAKTLTGNSSEISYPAMPVSIKTPVCPVVVCPPPYGAEGEWTISKQNGNSIHAEFENPQGELFGFVLTGEFISERSKLMEYMPDWM